MSLSITRLAALVALVTLAYCALSVWVVALPATVPALVTSGACMLVFHAVHQLLVVPASHAQPAQPATVFATDDAFAAFLVDPRSPRYAVLTGDRVCCPDAGTVCRHSDTYTVTPLDVM